jgi:hypothetical protein
MNFRWPLVFASFLCLIVGIWDFVVKPPDSDEIFGASNEIAVKRLQALVFTPPRGTPRIRLVDSTRKIYVIDCLTHTQLCSGVGEVSDVLSEGKLFKLNGQFYWPLEASFTSGRILDRSESAALYDIYRERDSQFYRFWIGLSFALLIFSFWFGRRSMFD